MTRTVNDSTSVSVRTGQAAHPLSEEEFAKRFRSLFYDPAFAGKESVINQLMEVAWNAHQEKRKSPVTRTAGAGFFDPDYELSVEWLATRDAIEVAQRSYENPSGPTRILLICGAARNDNSCPGEMSKTFRLAGMARHFRGDGRGSRPSRLKPPYLGIQEGHLSV